MPVTFATWKQCSLCFLCQGYITREILNLNCEEDTCTTIFCQYCFTLFGYAIPHVVRLWFTTLVVWHPRWSHVAFVVDRVVLVLTFFLNFLFACEYNSTKSFTFTLHPASWCYNLTVDLSLNNRVMNWFGHQVACLFSSSGEECFIVKYIFFLPWVLWSHYSL